MSEFIDKFAKIVDSLQSHPDKNVINAITRIAQDVSSRSVAGVTAADIVGVVEGRIFRASSERRLSLLYVVDSILYNVKAPYRELFENNITKDSVNEAPERDKSRFVKTLTKWEKDKIFHPAIMQYLRAHSDPDYRGPKPEQPPKIPPRNPSPPMKPSSIKPNVIPNPNEIGIDNNANIMFPPPRGAPFGAPDMVRPPLHVLQDPAFQNAVMRRADQILHETQFRNGLPIERHLNLAQVYESRRELYNELCHQAEQELLRRSPSPPMPPGMQPIQPMHMPPNAVPPPMMQPPPPLPPSSPTLSIVNKLIPNIPPLNIKQSEPIGSRSWYLGELNWIEYNPETKQEENDDEAASQDENPMMKRSASSESVMSDLDETAVPEDENQRACALSGEKFERYWSDRAGEWMYKNAIRPNPNGPIYNRDVWFSQMQQGSSSESKRTKM